MATLPLQLPAPAPPWVVHSTGRGAESPLAADAAERDDFERRMQVAWPWVVRLVDRLLGWPERASDVEDVAQEVFLAAWRGRAGFRGEAQWSTWVHRIAVTRARNAARSRERRQRWFGRLVPRAALEGTAADDAVELGGDAAGVQRALGLLRHADREVLVLRYLEDRGVDEIASELGLGRAATDARLSRARKRLREHIEGAQR